MQVDVRWNGAVQREFSREDPRKGENLEDLDVNRRIILICIFKKWVGEAWTRLLWLRIGICSRTFRFHKMRGIS
jgi:hypothetical protein